MIHRPLIHEDPHMFADVAPRRCAARSKLGGIGGIAMNETTIIESVDYVDDAAFARALRMTALAGGIVGIVLGVILLVWPHTTILVVTALLGISLILSGLLTLARALFSPETRGASARVLPAIGGLFTVAIGAICLRHLSDSVALLAAIFGVAWLIMGIAEVFGAFSHGKGGSIRTTMLILGIVSILGGVVVLVWPIQSVVALTILIGIWLLFTGLVQLWIAWRLRSYERRVDHAVMAAA
jgi:uncharacterized membrane protein HdeD (DUF308 family)